MNKSDKTPIIGILGGVGSGKSTVAAEFVKLGCKAIDADKIAHQLLETEAVKSRVITSFGADILDSAGKIDRVKLAKLVFCSNEKLSVLNNILHPLVLGRVEQLISEYNHQPEVVAIVLDMPLLAEVGWEKRCDMLIFVDCKRGLRAKRAGKNGFFNKKQLETRENFQISLDNKIHIADNTIDNNSDFSVLVGQVADIFQCIVNKK